MDIKKEIEKINCGEVLYDISLKNYNTYKVDSVALAIVFPNNIDELKNILKFVKEKKIRYKIIGNGSNLIFTKKYYDIVFINLRKFNKVDITEEKVVALSGVNLMKLAYDVSKKGLSGLEFATGIPATVGGAVYMNAGAYNSSISDILVSAKILTDKLEIIELSNQDFEFSYRSSLLQKLRNYICLEATFLLKKGNCSDILELIENRKNRRLASQPLNYPSAGSVFRNPSSEIFAGKLIEELSLKGTKIGGAKVSEKHANFVINYANATGSDIKELIIFVHEMVKDKYGIDLKVEQEFIE